jgi:hypothetical protein
VEATATVANLFHARDTKRGAFPRIEKGASSHLFKALQEVGCSIAAFDPHETPPRLTRLSCKYQVNREPTSGLEPLVPF